MATGKPGDEEVIYRRFITKNGKTLDARNYGKKAFRIVIRRKKK